MANNKRRKRPQSQKVRSYGSRMDRYNDGPVPRGPRYNRAEVRSQFQRGVWE